MPTKKIILLILIPLILLNVGLLFYYFTLKKDTPLDAPAFEIRSEDPGISLTLRNSELLELYAKKLRVSNEKGIGIIVDGWTGTP